MKKAFWLSGIALMMLFPLSAWAADTDHPIQDDTTLIADENPSPHPPSPGEYWLGIEISPLPPILRAQLHLPENQGIVVQGVMPDSPAAKAGLAQYDVVLKADDKKLSDVPDLLQAIEVAKDKEMKLEIIRDGQPKTIAITPAKRPEAANIPPGPPPGGDFEAFQRWFGQMQPGAMFGQHGPMQFRFFRPGVILPPGAPIHPPLPGNMSIIITKTGDKPADIVVKMDDEKWEVTEKDLDKLPEKVRPHVDRMLGLATGMGAGAMRWVPEMVPPFSPQELPPGPGGSGGSGPVGPGFHPWQGSNNVNLPPLPNIERRMEKRFEEIKQRIEKIENELKERYQGDKTPEHPQAVEKNKESDLEKSDL